VGQYSLVVFAPHGVAIPEPLVLLGQGINAFTVFTDDIDSVVETLKEEGCDIKAVELLKSEPTTSDDLYLEGERVGADTVPEDDD
jgi:hypothetical protein